MKNIALVGLISGLAVVIIGLALVWDEPYDGADGPPHLTGVILLMGERSVLVAEGLEGDEEYDGNSDRLRGEAISFAVTEETVIHGPNEDTLAFDDLEIGSEVEMWHTGIVAESYPGQATAAQIHVTAWAVDGGEEEASETEEFESTEDGISFRYPEGASVTHEAGRVKVTFVGPESHMTQITDGFTFFVHSESRDERSVGDVARQEFDEQVEVLDPIEEPHEVEFRGESAYRFVIEGGLGNEHTYLVFPEDDMVFITSFFVIDPGDRGYNDMIDNILESVASFEG